MIAAAAKNNNDSENDDPSAVIIKDVAQTVVIHICLPPGVSSRLLCHRLIPYYAEGKKLLIKTE